MPPVDGHERKRTLARMNALTSPELFWQMARRRGVDYCVLSHAWSPKVLADPELGPLTVPRYLRPVYVADKIHILEVVEQPDQRGLETDNQPNAQ